MASRPDLRRVGVAGVLAAVGAYVVLRGGFAWLADTATRLATLLMLLAVLIVWLVVALRDRRWRPSRPLAVTVVALLTASAISTALSPSPRLAAETLLSASVDAGIFLALTRLSAHPSARPLVRSVLLVLPALAVVWYLGQVVAAWISWWGAVGALVVPPLRPFDVSLYLDASPAVGALFLATVPFSVVLLARLPSRWRAGAGGLAILAAFAVIVTASRAAYVGLAIEIAVGAVAVAVAVLAAARRRRSIPGVSLRLAAGAGLLALAVLVLGGPLLARLLDLHTFFQRLDLWASAASLFSASPLVGQGPGTWPMLKFAAEPVDTTNLVLPHAHNVVLQLAAETGLLGLVAAIAIALVIARTLLRGLRAGDRETRLVSVAATAVALGFLGASLFDAFTLLRGVMYPAFLGLAYAIGGVDGWETPGSRRRHAFAAAALARGPAWTRAGGIAIVVGLVLAVGAVPVVIRAGAAALESDRGANALWDRDRRTAGQAFENALAIDPDFPLYRIEEATVAAHDGSRSARAGDLLRSVIPLDGNPRTLLSLAWLELRAGRGDAAMELAVTADHRTASDPGVSVNVAAIAEATGHRDLALAAWRAAYIASPGLAAGSSWSPSSEEALRLLIADRHASGSVVAEGLLEAYTDPRRAVSVLEAAPSSPDRDRSLAIALVRAGRANEAALLLKGLLDRSRQDPATASLLAGVEASLGDTTAQRRFVTWAEGLGVSSADIASLTGLRIARAGDTGLSDYPRDYPWAVYLRMTPPILTPPEYLVVVSSSTR